MTGFQNLKLQLLPLVKGLPLVVGVFVGFVFTGKKIISYSPNVYQTIAKIKLDDQKHGMSNNNLYADFDVFSTENKITTEAEVLKSPILIEKALDSIKLDVVIFRQGKLKNTMLYDDSPLSVSYSFQDVGLYKKMYFIDVISETSYTLTIGENEEGTQYSGIFGDTIHFEGGQLIISKNLPLLLKNDLTLMGKYQIKIFSKEALVKDILSRLDVKAVDKEIAILRVVYKEEHPQKAADFANVLCQVYLNDYMLTKSNAANLTVGFIDEQLAVVGKRLREAEYRLKNFKENNGVVNTTQETETGLREISKLNIQLINLKTTERAMKQILFAINNSEEIDLGAVKFGFGDLLMTELIKKQNNLKDQRKEALLKYKEESENVKVIDSKIEEINLYLKQAIKQNLVDIEIQRGSIELQVLESSRMFDDLPEREKNYQILDREFHLQEEVYNFLSQKRIEASIAANALLSFHRIIQKAEVPTAPVSPNSVLITFVMGLLGLIVGISFIYLRKYIKARVLTRNDIEKHTTLPVLSVIRKLNKTHDFEQLSKTILLKNLVKKNQLISISSTLNKEGRSYVSKYLAEAFHKLGYSVCLVRLAEGKQSDIQMDKLDSFYEKCEINGVDATALTLLKQKYDFVIVDSIPTALEVSGIEIMAISDLNLYLIRANHTCHNYVPYPEILAEEYSLSNIQLVLNDGHIASNYTGNFVGSRFQKTHKPKGLINKLKYYYQTYIA
ncbi:MAG: GNVR domain-containing protein [Putridiphycobacter sp.]|nr:GNVR domain-containing protein [Putridiphycobacter sp.]